MPTAFNIFAMPLLARAIRATTVNTKDLPSGYEFDLRQLFTNNEQGAWYDLYDKSTLFQDAAGTTPWTAYGQPLGLQLDKSKGLVLGAELVSNGQFTDSSGWVLQAETSISGGSLNFATAATRTATSTGANCISGRWYKIEFDYTYTSGIGRFGAGGGTTNISSTSGRKSYIWLSTGTSDFFFTCSSGGATYSVDNLTVRELPGNHRYQTTPASRPTIEARVNLLTKTEELDHADWGKVGVTVTANAAVGYDGSMSLDKIVEVSAASIPRISQSRPTVIGAQYVAYFDAKAAERTQIRIVAEGSSLRAAYYNLSTGTVISQGMGASAYISALGNGLYRCWLVYTATIASSYLYVTTAESGSTIASGDPTKGVFLGRADFRAVAGAAYPYQRVNTATDYADIGAPRRIKYDGIDDFLRTASVNFSATDKMTVWSGGRKLSDAAA